MALSILLVVLVDLNAKREDTSASVIVSASPGASPAEMEHAGVKTVSCCLNVEEATAQDVKLFSDAAGKSAFSLANLGDLARLSMLVEALPGNFTVIDGTTIKLWYRLPGSPDARVQLQARSQVSSTSLSTQKRPHAQEPLPQPQHLHQAQPLPQPSEERPLKKPKKLQASQKKIPNAVSNELHDRADRLMPREANGKFRPVEEKAVKSWRDDAVIKMRAWCTTNGFDEVTVDDLSKSLTDWMRQQRFAVTHQLAGNIAKSKRKQGYAELEKLKYDVWHKAYGKAFEEGKTLNEALGEPFKAKASQQQVTSPSAGAVAAAGLSLLAAAAAGGTAAGITPFASQQQKQQQQQQNPTTAPSHAVRSVGADVAALSKGLLQAPPRQPANKFSGKKAANNQAKGKENEKAAAPVAVKGTGRSQRVRFVPSRDLDQPESTAWTKRAAVQAIEAADAAGVAETAAAAAGPAQRGQRKAAVVARCAAAAQGQVSDEESSDFEPHDCEDENEYSWMNRQSDEVDLAGCVPE